MIENNYEKIIKSYDLINIKNKVNKYSVIIKNIFNKYILEKQLFYNRLSSIKPTIFRDKEITSISNFIDPLTKNEINPKKIEIYFNDGKIILYYKIVDYEFKRPTFMDWILRKKRKAQFKIIASEILLNPPADNTVYFYRVENC
jgi:hypothetical protein